jgi:hypothetical protein
MPPQSLGTAVIVASLLLAVAALVTAIRNRGPDRFHSIGMIIVQALVTAEVVVGLVHLAQGAHPHEYATFIGYLIAIFLILPVGAGLARLEPTRWGALIVAVAALVVPILIVRINQLWSGVG